MNLTLFSSSSIEYDTKRFRMRKTFLKRFDERSELEISEAAEVLQVLFIQANPFLSKFVDNGELKNLIRHMNIESFEANSILFTEGDTGDKFYIIYEGRVGISIKEQIVSELKKGDSFGELSLLFGQPRSGTAIILEWTELISLSRESYELIIKVTYN